MADNGLQVLAAAASEAWPGEEEFYEFECEAWPSEAWPSEKGEEVGAEGEFYDQEEPPYEPKFYAYLRKLLDCYDPPTASKRQSLCQNHEDYAKPGLLHELKELKSQTSSHFVAFYADELIEMLATTKKPLKERVLDLYTAGTDNPLLQFAADTAYLALEARNPAVARAAMHAVVGQFGSFSPLTWRAEDILARLDDPDHV
jgi:hypothetical protein